MRKVPLFAAGRSICGVFTIVDGQCFKLECLGGEGHLVVQRMQHSELQKRGLDPSSKRSVFWRSVIDLRSLERRRS